MNTNKPSLKIKIPNTKLNANGLRTPRMGTRTPIPRTPVTPSRVGFVTPTVRRFNNTNATPTYSSNSHTNDSTISISTTSTPISSAYSSSLSSAMSSPVSVSTPVSAINYRSRGHRIAPKPNNIRPFVGINNKPAFTRDNATRSLIHSTIKPYTGPKTLKHSNKTTRNLTKKGGRRTFYNPIKTRKLRR